MGKQKWLPEKNTRSIVCAGLAEQSIASSQSKDCTLLFAKTMSKLFEFMCEHNSATKADIEKGSICP